ncbi:MAG: phage tail tape measure protein, partial [Eggerthella sp.]|uniref:phage tail tape measure protein n=1 Tax=Eggerthella sp. TaxID=1929886 RepID=UPI0028FF3C5D
MDGSVVIEAILDTSKVEKGVKDVNSSLNGVSWKGITEGDKAAQKLSGSLKSAGTAATVGLTAPIIAAGTAAFTTASSYEQATARIQSALGLTSEEAEHLGDVGEGIYENGFGQSLDLVSDALITVRQNLGDLNDQDLEYVTQAALTLSDTLGMDVGESVRGVNALMDGFGMSAQDAMDLFVAGAQDGLNYSDELGDNLAEYGPRFAQMGFSAQDYFSILKAGTENGAYNLDKVNDFLNEFQTSLVDGRMDESIGRFSESTQQLFEAWKTGGATGQQV